jgi:hypothetical protein
MPLGTDPPDASVLGVVFAVVAAVMEFLDPVLALIAVMTNLDSHHYTIFKIRIFFLKINLVDLNRLANIF